jgi:hypothetical protein
MQILNMAPTEHNVPKSLYHDAYAEEMAYPTLFGGQHRPHDDTRRVRLHYSDIVNSELLRRDRRFAGHIPNLFYKVKKQQVFQVCAAASVRMRKADQGSGKNITASQVCGEPAECV